MRIVTPNDLGKELGLIWRAIKKLQAGSQLGNSAVTRGRLQLARGGQVDVLDEDNESAVLFGKISWDDGTIEPGLIVNRNRAAGGTPVVTFKSGARGVFRAYARDGDDPEIFAEDIVSGMNLARPYIPFVMAPDYAYATSPGWPAVTASGWTTMWAGSVFRQLPRFYVALRHSTDASGDYRLVCDGQPTSTVISVGPGAGPFSFTDLWPVGGNYTLHTVEVQARVTSSSGTLRATVCGSYQVQSS